MEADVNYSVAKRFANRVKEKALGQEVLSSVKPGSSSSKSRRRARRLHGRTARRTQPQGQAGRHPDERIAGSGKTTHTAKLALHLRTQHGKRPCWLPVTSTALRHRPARGHGKQVGADVFTQREQKDPVAIAEAALRHARAHGNVVIVDTAGRLAVDADMMDEIDRIQAAIQPSETCLSSTP